jgi:steroid 5-alpha reductase family enzyme
MVFVNGIIETGFRYLDYWFPMYAAWVLLTITFFVAQSMNDNSIIDIAWGLGFMVQCGLQLLCRTTLVDKDPISWRPLLVFALVSLWSIRLSWHIGSRHGGEDWRYKILRKRFHHPNPLIFKIKIYLLIFILQWVMMSI